MALCSQPQLQSDKDLAKLGSILIICWYIPHATLLYKSPYILVLTDSGEDFVWNAILRKCLQACGVHLVFCTGLTAGAKADTVPAPVRTVTRKGTGTGEPRCVTGIVILPAGHEPRVCMYGVGSET